MPTNQSTPAIVNVTPALAAEWLATRAYPKQRKLLKARVTDYAAQMLAGDWQSSLSTILFANLDEHIYLIDGQHRLQAVVNSNLPQHFIVNTIDVSSDEQVADLYSSIDRGRPRTLLDSFVAHDLAAHIGVSQTVINDAGAAVRLILTNFKRNSSQLFSSSVANQAILTYGDAIFAYCTEIAGTVKHQKYALYRSPVIGGRHRHLLLQRRCLRLSEGR